MGQVGPGDSRLQVLTGGTAGRRGPPVGPVSPWEHTSRPCGLGDGAVTSPGGQRCSPAPVPFRGAPGAASGDVRRLSSAAAAS